MLWVLDNADDRVYAYDLPAARAEATVTHWSGESTVKSLGTSVGYGSHIPGSTLNPTTFDVGETTYTVATFTFMRNNISNLLNVRLSPHPDPATVSNWRLLAGGTAFDFSDAAEQGAIGFEFYQWRNVGELWSADDTVQLSITADVTNSPAAGAPPVIEFDEALRPGLTLTVDASPIEDADGLGEFYYRWYRVFGESETLVPGVTGGSYTLTEDDVDRGLRVRVAYNDQAGFQEYPRASRRTPFVLPPLDYTVYSSFDVDSVNSLPKSIWSDGTTIWIGDDTDGDVYAYNMDGTRDSTKDITTSLRGEDYYITGDERYLYTAEHTHESGDFRSVLGWHRSDRSAAPDRTFYYNYADGTLSPVSLTYAVATDGRDFWIAQNASPTVRNFRIEDDVNTAGDEYGDYDSSRTISFSVAPYGLYTDGVHLWAAQLNSTEVEVRKAADGSRVTDLDFDLDSDNDDPEGIWTNGVTAFVVDGTDDKVYTYRIANTPALGFPTIEGVARVSEELSVNTATIHDVDGVHGVTYNYAWWRQVGDTRTQIGTNSDTYRLVADDVGATIVVNVFFNDEGGYAESLWSDPTPPIVAASAEAACDAGDSDCSGPGPRNVKLRDHADGLQLTWDPPPAPPSAFEQTVRQYEIERSEDGGDYAILTCLDGAATEYVDESVEADKSYAYQVRAIYHVNESCTTLRDIVNDVTATSGNASFNGIWSDGTTIWGGLSDEKLIAYSLESGARESSKDITLTRHADDPLGVWGDGTHIWVGTDQAVSPGQGGLIAYKIADGLYDSSVSFDTLSGNMGYGEESPIPNVYSLSGDDSTFWLSSLGRRYLFAYDRSTGARTPSGDIRIPSEIPGSPVISGHWRDTEHNRVYLLGQSGSGISVLDLDDHTRATEYEVRLRVDGSDNRGMWTDGEIVWVSQIFDRDIDGDNTDEKQTELRAYPLLPDRQRTTWSEARDFTERVLVSNTGQTPSLGATNIDATRNGVAQAFTTGPNPGGYELSSVGFSFDTIADLTAAGSELTLTLHLPDTTDDANPAATAECTLTDPASFTASGVQTFGAPTAEDDLCPTLEPETTYLVVLTTSTTSNPEVSLKYTASDSEDVLDPPTGWTIADTARQHTTSWAAFDPSGAVPQIEIKGQPSEVVRPAHCDGSELWCETLTVGEATTIQYGWKADGSHAGAELASSSFEFDGQSYRFVTLVINSSGDLVLEFAEDGAGDIATAATRKKFVLHVDDDTYDFGDGTYLISVRELFWESSGLTWTKGQEVSLKITEVTPRLIDYSSTSPDTGDAFRIGDSLPVSAIFSHPVDVGGRPQWTINVGGSEEILTYFSGSGTAGLNFIGYTVAEGVEDIDGISYPANPISLNGGSIKLEGGGADADLTFPAVPNQPTKKVDGIRPTLVSAETSTDGSQIILTFSEPISLFNSTLLDILHLWHATVPHRIHLFDQRLHGHRDAPQRDCLGGVAAAHLHHHLPRCRGGRRYARQPDCGGPNVHRREQHRAAARARHHALETDHEPRRGRVRQLHDRAQDRTLRERHRGDRGHGRQRHPQRHDQRLQPHLHPVHLEHAADGLGQRQRGPGRRQRRRHHRAHDHVNQRLGVHRAVQPAERQRQRHRQRSARPDRHADRPGHPRRQLAHLHRQAQRPADRRRDRRDRGRRRRHDRQVDAHVRHHDLAQHADGPRQRRPRRRRRRRDAGDHALDHVDQRARVRRALRRPGRRRDGRGRRGDAVRVSKSSLSLAEHGSDTYTVRLGSEPTHDVTITVTRTGSADVSVNSGSTATLTFTSSNWQTPQTIAVSAAADADKDPDTATITHTASSSDSDYHNISIPDVAVTVREEPPPTSI